LAGLAAAGQTAPAWADATTGKSPVVWSRALGWYAMALVDVLEFLPNTHADYQAVVDVLKDIAAGVKATQDATTGLWSQVVDQGAKADNWVETSGSAMMIYALKKGVRLGALATDYDAVASKGWQGLLAKITVSGKTVTVKGAVGGMSVLNDYASYISKKSLVADNVPQGLAAVLIAASEMEY
jgi:unsaturated rhamnogalacturonyl hydrolase